MERNINSLTGYSLKASNGEIGDVKEFYFDDETWKIEYLVIKTGGWLSGREVLIAPHAVKKVDWLNRFFKVSLTKNRSKIARISISINLFIVSTKSSYMITMPGKVIG